MILGGNSFAAYAAIQAVSDDDVVRAVPVARLDEADLGVGREFQSALGEVKLLDDGGRCGGGEGRGGD